MARMTEERAIALGKRSGEASFAACRWTKAEAIQDAPGIEACGIDGDWGRILPKGASSKMEAIAVAAAKGREREMILALADE